MTSGEAPTCCEVTAKAETLRGEGKQKNKPVCKTDWLSKAAAQSETEQCWENNKERKGEKSAPSPWRQCGAFSLGESSSVNSHPSCKTNRPTHPHPRRHSRPSKQKGKAFQAAASHRTAIETVLMINASTSFISFHFFLFFPYGPGGDRWLCSAVQSSTPQSFLFLIQELQALQIMVINSSYMRLSVTYTTRQK